MCSRFLGQALLCSLLLATAAWCQTPQIAAVYDLLGRTSLCSPDSVYAYGVYPADNNPSFNATVGGETEGINFIEVTNGAGYAIQFNIPADLPTGSSTIVISHDGTPSNSFPITIHAVCPAIAADGSAFRHDSNGAPVTTSFPAAPGESIVLQMSGLGHTNPVQPLGSTAASPLPSAIDPSLTVAGLNAQVQFAGKPPGTVGYSDQVIFVVPAQAPSGADALLVSTDGVSSNTVQLLVGTTQLPASPEVQAIVNGANFTSGKVAPGSFLSIFGKGFGSNDNLYAFPSTQVNAISVQIGGEMAPISSLIGSQGQINVVVPNDAPIYGALPLTVETPDGPQDMESMTAISMVSAAPGIFLVNDPSDSSRRVAAALFANTSWLVLSAAQTTALGLPACTPGGVATVACGGPAQPGDSVEIYVTGLGKATPNGDPNGAVLPTGQAAPASGNPIYKTPQLAVVTVGGTAATVQFSGLAPGFAGLYQVNFQIPAGTAAGENVPLQISMPGSTVTDSATIAIQ
jgi:uncharacterized protein (TIGR03437 family)